VIEILSRYTKINDF